MHNFSHVELIDKASELLHSLIEIGYEYGIYTNRYTIDELKIYIENTCFSGVTYKSSQKNRFPRLAYPLPCQKVSSSGKLAKSSIIQMAYNNTQNTVSIYFPITLLRKITIIPNFRKTPLEQWKDFIRQEIKASLVYIFKKKGIVDKQVFENPALVKQYLALFEMEEC